MRAHSSIPVACSSMAKIILPPFFYFFKFGIQHCRVAEDAINNIDEVIITDYFYRGFQYSAIIGLLKKRQRPVPKTVYSCENT